MNNNKAFKDRDLIGICWYLINYCETYININTVSTEHASTFHSFLPTLLTYIFGSPTTRGWLQTDTRPEQDDAIRQLLDPRGQFLAALIKLGTRPEYCYDMTTEKFPDDIRKVLAAGAIQYLPRVYDNCAFLDISKVKTSTDLRASATRQSSIFPRPSVGEFRIRFNMIQFYLYYFAIVPTWTPLIPTIPTLNPPTTAPYATRSTPSSSYYAKTPYSTSNQPKPPPPSTTTSNNNGLPYMIPGEIRSLNASIYNEMLRLYMRAYIPCVVNDTAPYVNGVGTFFLDALIELWIRTIWISPTQKLSLEFIQCLASFLKYVVGGDLRRCASYRQNNNNMNLIDNPVQSAYTNLYRSIKDELYLLLSRLATNWRRQDDYIWVLNIWTLWAAPWRLGKDSITLTTDGLEKDKQPMESSSPTSSTQLAGASSSPLETGWAVFILENAWYYLTLTDSILQRISTFTYPDKSLPPPPTGTNQAPSSAGPSYLKTPSTPASTTPPRPLEGSSLYGELKIVQQLVNVWKSKHLVDYLGQIEDGLELAAQKRRLAPPSNTTDKPTSIYQSMNFLQNTKAKFSSALLSSMTGDRQQHPDDILGNLSSICYAGERTHTDTVMHQLEALRDQILSVSEDQQWKPSNIYSTQRQPRSSHLVKSLHSLCGAMDTRIQSIEKQQTWKPSVLGGQKRITPSKDVATISAILTELVSLLKLPFPDGSRSMSTNQSAIDTSSGPSSTLTNRQVPSTPLAPQKTEQPTWATSRRERPKVSPLGPRVETCVRSFENKLLLRWALSLERRVNSIYYWSRIPYVVFTPDYLSFRWMAAPINLVYLIIIFLVIYFII